LKRKQTAAFAKDDSPSDSAPTPTVVLKEVVDLLEEYAPMWYSEELHNRAMAALSKGNQQRRTG
jgi:hypothetical protein